jgi:hypothetical protein
MLSIRHTHSHYPRAVGGRFQADSVASIEDGDIRNSLDPLPQKVFQ